jgi:predicted enzyme related to lactoylglutathione lyase
VNLRLNETPRVVSGFLQFQQVVIVDDVDGTAKKTTKLGGNVVMEPVDVPGVGHIAVLLDPQGAAFGLFKPA